ncbi:hypothetical protein C1T31_04630 [Hanstruepera neustonica]|uniref:DUF998 domain-containing protein n=1 Tax=Hanstruepera neustonica TaxID=1445657 RepID=A0A2K1E026_9FLAO|nr:DUF998 domain-containing protein [Hanstruepera neustonica]PNQ73629.1 hypothetical protein C1T31_04630 [Hanstruepera neustonica]
MKNKHVFFIGILGAFLFFITSLIGGFLIDGYDINKQFISETYAVDTKYGFILRIFGYIPSGILFTIFCFLSLDYFKNSRWTKIGFYGVGIFYGLATIVVAIFPCDSGCNKELINPSTSQLIHNLTGLLTYAIVPLSIVLIGFGEKRFGSNSFAMQSFALGGMALLFIIVLFISVDSDYVGLIQRIVELTFVLWIMLCALTVKNKKASR